MSHGPIRFAPVAMPKVWGGRRLAEILGRDIPDGPVGECWDVSGRPEAPSRAITGPRPGATPAELVGGPFPLLVKVLDAADRLSVQVHPGAEAARRFPGAQAKHEMWVVLDATPGAVIWRGFVDGVDRAAVEAALRDGRIEELLVTVSPRRGDVIEIVPGTVHAIGPGCLLLEVQEASDTTYRAWDWARPGLDGKPRPLHVEEALACLRFEAVGPPRLASGPPRAIRETLVDAPVLRVERARVVAGDALALAPGRVHVVSNIGEGEVRLRDDDLPLRYGDSALMLPGEAEVVVAEGEPSLLLLTSAEMTR